MTSGMDEEERGEDGDSAGSRPVRIVMATLVTVGLLAATLVAWPRPEPALAKIAFDLSSIDDEGLHGPQNGRTSRAYEFCIPDDESAAAEVRSIDRTIELSRSPGRVGCTTAQLLAVGNTHQPGWLDVLTRLARLPYVRRIGPWLGE